MALYAWLTLFFGLVAVLGVVGTTLWIAFAYPDEQPDYSEARRYLAEKTAMEHGADVVPAIPVPHREPITHEHPAAA